MSHSLISRVAGVESNFNREIELEARLPHEFELNLDNQQVLRAINTLNFFQIKG